MSGTKKSTSVAGWLWGAVSGSGASGSSELGAQTEALLKQLALCDVADAVSFAKLICQLKDLANHRDTHEYFQSYISSFVKAIQSHPTAIQLIKDVIDLLFQICTPPEQSDNLSQATGFDHSSVAAESNHDPKAYIELMNASELVGNVENLNTVLSLLALKDFYVRFSCTQLFISLLRSGKLAPIQDAVLHSHSMPRIIELLRDDRDSVRNEALLLLIELVQSNEEIQKLVAFEGTFEILFQIMHREEFGNGRSDQCIVVLDCLTLLGILLKSNVLNQNYFRETGCVPQLSPLISVKGSDMWLLTEKKMECLAAALHLISILVQPSNASTPANQDLLRKYHIPEQVLRLAIGRVNSVIIRSRALRTLAGLLRQQTANHHLMATTSMTLPDANGSNPMIDTKKESLPMSPSKALRTNTSEQPALARLLRVTLDATSYFERSSALRAFSSYLYENHDGQLGLVSTLTPVPVDSADVGVLGGKPIGRQLISSILSYAKDPLRSWFSSLVLSYIVRHNEEAQEFLLKVPQSLPIAGEQMKFLANEFIRIFFALPVDKSIQPIAVIGYLRFCCHWVAHSARVAEYFFKQANTVSFLVEVMIQPTGNIHIRGLCALFFALSFLYTDDPTLRNNLHNLIAHRVGVDKFVEKLGDIRKSLAFMAAEQDTDPEKLELSVDEQSFEQFDQSLLFYDYEFTVFFKDVYDELVRELKSFGQPAQAQRTPSRSSSKTMKRQADEIAALKQELQMKEKEIEIYKLQCNNLQQQIDMLRSAPSELKAETAAAAAAGTPMTSAREEELQQRVKMLEQALLAAEKIHGSTASKPADSASDAKMVSLQAELQNVRKQYERLMKSYGMLQSELHTKNAELAAALKQNTLTVPHPEGKRPEAAIGVGGKEEEFEKLRDTCDQLKHENARQQSRHEAERANLNRQLEAAKKQLAEMPSSQDVSSASTQTEDLVKKDEQIRALSQELIELRATYEATLVEQEELLGFFAKLEIENSELKMKLESGNTTKSATPSSS